MSNSKLRSLDLIQVDGGLSTKQGDTWSRIAYQLVDENEESIRVNDAENVTVYLKNENGLYQLNGILEGDEVGFYLTPQVTNGSYQVEIQIKHETGRISKFPSTNTMTLKVVKSLVNQESLTVSVMDIHRNNNLPEDPETGEKVLVAGDNSTGWYHIHSNACEITLTTNASDPLKLYSDFPEKRTFEPDNSSSYDYNKASFVDVFAGDDRSGHYIHERRNIDSHFIKISVSAFMVEEPRVLSIPITDMSTGSSTTFDIKVYPYNWYDPETKLIRNPSVNTEETEDNKSNQPVVDNSHIVVPPSPISTPSSNESNNSETSSTETTENHSKSEGSTTSPQEGNTFTQPTIDKSELIRLEEEKLKAEGYKILKNKHTGDKEYQSLDMMENFILIVRDGVVTRDNVIPNEEEDYEQIWPVVFKSKPITRDLVKLLTPIEHNNPSYEKVRSLDINKVMREFEGYLYIISDGDIALLEGDLYSSMIPQLYTFKYSKEYLENGIKEDPTGEPYIVFYFVAEYEGNKYYVEANERVWPSVELRYVEESNGFPTIVLWTDPDFQEVRSRDTEGFIRDDKQMLYIIRDEDISELTEGEFSGNHYIPEYTYTIFKEHLENGNKVDPDGITYPIFYLVTEYNGNKYYVKGE